MNAAIRWSVACGALIVAFFVTWGLCRELAPHASQGVMLGLAALTSGALESLARAYRQAGRRSAAYRTYQQVMRICLHTVGADSPLTRRVRDEMDDLDVPRRLLRRGS